MKEVLKLALEALINAIAVRNGEGGTKLVSPLEENAITAIKEALAQDEQEPMAWTVVGDGKFGEIEIGQHAEIDLDACRYWVSRGYSLVPLYTAAPKRPWVELTDEEIETCRERAFSTNNPYCPVDKKSMWKAYQYLEAKLKELNT